MSVKDIFSVKDSVVCIAGGSRGLGKGLAKAFVERGAKVVVGSWNETELHAIQNEFSQINLDLAIVHADVQDPKSCQHLVSSTIEEYGRIDTMICNAGIDIIKPAEAYDNDEWDSILDVNLKGAYFCAKHAATAMLAAGKGSIIITSSIAGASGIPGLTPYAASKGGINQLVRTMGVEWAKRGVRVNAVAPGYINNFMEGVDGTLITPYQQRAIDRTPMGRRGEINEFIGSYLFLSSDASTYMTGEVLYVDGGYHAG